MAGDEGGRDPDEPNNFRPDYRNYLVCCDESGIHGAEYYGFGSLWMPWDRRGDFTNLVTTLRDVYEYPNEIKWTRVSRRNLAFCKALVEEFFRTRWLMFHCLIVKKADVDKSLHTSDDPYDLAMQKHFAKFLETKIRFFGRGQPDKAYHAWVDPLPFRYKKAGEAASNVINATLKQRLKVPALHSLRERDSRATPGIQLADLLLGAVMADWQQDASADPKLDLVEHVAGFLGWQDLRADTRHTEWKFNVWYFFDPTEGRPRRIKTRDVRHRIPTPALRRGPR